MLGPVSKATEVLGHDASASHVEAAITMACSEPAGAVHLDYDMSGTTTAGEPPAPTTPSEESTIAQAQTLIADATQPVVIIGIGALTDAQPVRDVLIDLGAPVFSTYQATGVLSSEHDLSAGLFTNGASERAILDQADLIITIGLDLVEPIPAAWTYDAPVVAISGCPAQDRYMPTAVEVVGDVADLVPRLLAASQEHKWNPTAGSSHRETVRKRFLAGEPSDVFGPLGLTNTVAALAPRQATVTVDAGAHFLAIMPFWPVTAPKHLLISNGLATMGYAVPAAIGAAFARPDQPVVALTGDGGLGMCLAELETIARHSLPIAVVVYNDAALSLIKIKQRNGHGGDSVVHYAPTDFAAVALGMGIESAIATSADDIERLLAGHGFDRPLLIDARIDPSSYPHLMTVTRG